MRIKKEPGLAALKKRGDFFPEEEMSHLEAVPTLHLEIILRSGLLRKIDERLIRYDAIIERMDDTYLSAIDLLRLPYRTIEIRRDELLPIRRPLGPIRAAEAGCGKTNNLIEGFVLPFFFPIDDRGDGDDFLDDGNIRIEEYRRTAE